MQKDKFNILAQKKQRLLQQHKHQHGLSLVQLLIGLAVGAFVVVMSAQMYFVIRNKYRITVTSMHNNTKVRMVSYAIRNAVDSATLSLAFGTWPWQTKTLRIPGATFNPLDYPPTYAAGSINGFTPNAQVVGTDILLIQRMINTEIITQLIPENNGATTIPTALNVMQNDFLLLANQQHYELMKTTDRSGTVSQGPSVNFSIGSLLGHYRTIIFYLRQNDANIRSLHINVDDARGGEELITNIDDFKIEHYINGGWQRVPSNGDASYITSWYRAVKGIRLNYTINNQAHQISIAIKANSAC